MVRCSEEQNSRNLFSDCKRYLENFDYKNAPWDEGNGENYVGKSLLSVLLAQTKSMPKREKRQALNDLIQRIDSEIIDHPWLARFFANQSKDSVSKTRNECLRRIISTYNTPDLILTAMKRFVATATDHEEYWEIDFQIGNILLQEQLTEDALQHWIGFLGRVPNSLSKKSRESSRESPIQDWAHTLDFRKIRRSHCCPKKVWSRLSGWARLGSRTR